MDYLTYQLFRNFFSKYNYPKIKIVQDFFLKIGNKYIC